MTNITSGRHACPRSSTSNRAEKSQFAGQAATPSLPLYGECTISTAIAAASEEWARGVAAGTMSAQTAAKASDLAHRFKAFASAHDVYLLDHVDQKLVTRFVNSRGRNRRGDPAPAAPATRRNRLATIRLLFTTARQVGLTVADPARDIAVPPRNPTVRRAVTEAEAEHIRFVSKPWSTSCDVQGGWSVG